MTRASSIDFAARWMASEFEKHGLLSQEDAATGVEAIDRKLVAFSDDGYLRIDSDVLQAFRKLAGRAAVWDLSARSWRARESFDE